MTPSKTIPPRGGTELMLENLLEHCGSDWQEWCSMHLIAPENYRVDRSKPNILWCHLNHENQNVQGLRDVSVKDQFDWFVFVSEWQRNCFLQTFNLDPERCRVIRNALKDNDATRNYLVSDKIKLCYTSMPWRGLSVLLDAIDLVDRNFELHVHSSLLLYGSDYEQATKDQYSDLFDRVKSHPRIIYHGLTDNLELRQRLLSYDILTYPSIFAETSCLSIIEAASSGCRIVATTLGAIPETTNGYAELVDIDKISMDFLPAVFAHAITKTIDDLAESQLQRQKQVEYFQREYDWKTRSIEWKNFFEEVKMVTLVREPSPTQRVYVGDDGVDKNTSDTPKKKIMIGTPTYDGKLDVWYVNSLIHTMNHPLARNYHIRPVWVSYDSLIQRARNDLVWFAREGNYDEVVFIDADLEWDPQHFFDLLNYPVDVVGGTYPKKSDEEIYVVRKKSPQQENRNEYGLLETDGLGTGFLKVSRKALDYLWDTSTPYFHNNRHQRWIFDVVIKNDDIHSEDIIMCEKLQNGGFPIWLDTRITCSHIGFKKYTGNFSKWYDKVVTTGQSSNSDTVLPETGETKYGPQRRRVAR